MHRYVGSLSASGPETRKLRLRHLYTKHIHIIQFHWPFQLSVDTVTDDTVFLAVFVHFRLIKPVFAKFRHDKTSRQILLLYHQLEKAFVQKHIRYTGQTVAEYSHEIAEAYELEEEMVHAFIADVFCAKFCKDRFEIGRASCRERVYLCV